MNARPNQSIFKEFHLRIKINKAYINKERLNDKHAIEV